MITACNPKAIPTVIFPAKPHTDKTPAPQTPAKIIGSATVNIFARDILNPAPDGTVSPVQVRVYLSEDDAIFDGVSFEKVFEFEGQTFDLKPKLTRTIQPGSLASVKLELANDETIIAIAVAFRDIGRTEWLKLVRIDSSKSTSISFVLSDFTVKHESEVS